MIKAELRREYLAQQRAISHEERDSASKRIADHFFSSFDLGVVSVLHSFVPIEKFNEVNTRVIFAKLWRDFPHIQTVVPRVDFETNAISNVIFTHETELVRNVWEIEEPAHDEFVETEKIDIVLVPGLCFDRAGHRVGYGKGFYDRFLKTCRNDCTKIGLSYFDPVDQIGETHAGDVRLDALIIPDGVMRTLRDTSPGL